MGNEAIEWNEWGNEVFERAGREGKPIAAGIVEYLDSSLWREGGGYFGSQDADEEYYALNLEERRARVAPLIDRAVYVNWNALAASSLIRASRYIDEPTLGERAGVIIDTLLKECYVEGKGMRHYSDDDGAHGEGLFEDQVWVCLALLDAFSSGGFPNRIDYYLRIALDLLDNCLAGYWDHKHGGFYDIAAEGSRNGRVGALGTRVKSLPDNALAAEVLRRAAQIMRLRNQAGRYYLRDPDDCLDKAERCLAAFGGSWREYGIIAAPYAKAVLHHLHPVSVEIGNKYSARSASEIFVRLNEEFIPWVDVLPGAPDGMTISVCAADSCFAPVGSADEALRVIRAASRLS